MNEARPLDALNNSRHKRVVVELKNGRQYIGNLKAFDMHMNIVLEGVEEWVNGEMKRKQSNVFIRGDAVVVIFPQ